jgi:hypothetical protein
VSLFRPWHGFIAVIWVIGLAGCGVTMFDPDEIDPTAPRVVPQVGDDAAVIETSAPEDFLTPGVEGSVLFVRLTDPAGALVLDRPFDWPRDQQRVPPGDYTMLLYFRGCEGNCSRLSREDDPFCEHEISLAADDRLRIAIESRDLGPGLTCTIGPA